MLQGKIMKPPCSRSEEQKNCKRFAAVAFSHLRIEIARERLPAHGPVAVVIAHPGSSVSDEGALLGNTRIDEVSDEAWTLGIRPGFTIAAARARSTDLAVRVVSSGAVQDALARVAEAALAFGRSSAFSAEDDMVFVDITGCEHLHAQPGDPSGAHTLAMRLQACVTSFGHAVRIAVARGPRMAAAFARASWRAPFGGESGRGDEPFLDTSDEALARLPISALALDAESIDWFTKLGLSTIADLRKLPFSELGSRLAGASREVMWLLRGEDETPITPYDPPEEPEERIELEYGIDSNESLLFVAKTLCARLSARLVGRTRCATHLELVFDLDRALLSDAESPRAVFSLRLSAPLRTSVELMSVIRARIESYALSAPVLAVTLRAAKLVSYEFRARDLFTLETRAELALPRLASELAADIGENRVGMFALENSWNPARRAALIPHASRPKKSKEPKDSPPTRLTTRAIEPVRFLQQPLPYEGAIPKASFLGRREAVEWWRAPAPPQDDLAIFIPELETMAWVVCDRQTKQMTIWGYIEHG